MAPRPAKRQRRSTIVLSDDSDDGGSERPLAKTQKSSHQREITLDGRTSSNVSPVKTAKQGKPTIAKKAAPKASPHSSPEKRRKSTSVKAEQPDKSSASLHSFFSKATADERWRKKSVTPPEVEAENGELLDAIEDDELSDDTLQELGLKTDVAGSVADRRKLATTPAVASLRNGSNGGSTLSSSQRFVRPPVRSRPPLNDVDQTLPEEGPRPWADRYGPTSLEELVVHKKKVSDVQNWLQGKIDGRNGQRMLVLKGPAGSGKTTTLSLVAKSLGLQLVPWHNPAVSETVGKNTTALQFDEFLNRSGRFGSLAFGQVDSTQSDMSTKQDLAHHVLVIEEFPATMTRLSGALQSFRSVILRYLARSRAAAPTATLRGQARPDDDPPPVVLIISETLLSSSTAWSDSFTAHRLLGPEILNNPYVTVMEFNPVAPTFVTKALDIVMKKEARDSRRRRVPGPAVVQKLAEMGDVRSAVNSLEFLCLRGDDNSEWSGTVAAKVKKSSKDSVPLTDMEKNSLQLVSQRETTLDMFHAAGKIVYNKREDPRVLDTRAEPPPKPPDHLMHLYTPKASQVDIEALLNETGTDIQTFISTLHENYILSCNGDGFEECFDGCSDVLSVSDVLNPESRPFHRTNPNPYASIIQANLQAGSSDALRQDEISFQVATRGLLFNLPYPVNRASPPGGKKGDTYKMFYPASLRLWKPTEELDSLIEMYVNGDVPGPGMGAGSARSLKSSSGTAIGDGGVATWRTRTLGANTNHPGTETDGDGDEHDDDQGDEDERERRQVRYAKDTLTLEVLPYMTRIFSAKRRDVGVLERITKFRPNAFLSLAVGDQGLEEEEDDDDTAVNTTEGIRSKVSASVGGHLRRSSHTLLRKMTPSGGAVGTADVGIDPGAVEKLYISDDDIEDD
ncbi:RFC checkpoint protein Rad17 [Knufia peltigerae]|uniref:RFC checkpoint protein Rad17 n=1 Tax=Knufia peltigerae TaxID=1002370 RepID=A0AA39D1G6_9EURO|nr:RFC checkpoint protein Rad17 [Knufia peltigerae]